MTLPNGRRLLILAPFPPGGVPAHGGANAIAQLIKSLSGRHRVALAYLRAQDESPADASLTRHCDVLIESRRPGLSSSSIRPLRRAPALIPRVLRGNPLWAASRWSPAFARELRRLAGRWKPDVVQAEFGAMGMYLPEATRTGARRVVTFHDPEPFAARERAARTRGAERLMWSIEALLWRRYDARLLGRIDAAIAFTERDARALASLRRHAPVRTVPLGVELPAEVGAREPLEDGRTAPPRLLFVGNFNHPPNVDAARYLLDQLYPRLRARHGTLEIALVGDGPPGWLVRRAGSGVLVPGFVPDLAPVLRSATVFVAPLEHGGGMRLKVLDALAAGTPVVGTSIGFAGTGVIHDRHALVADDVDAMCAAVDGLLRDPARRAALGRAGRAHVADTLSWDRTATAYGEVYESILESMPPAAGQRTPAASGGVAIGSG